VIKVILAVLILFSCVSIGYPVDFGQGDSWVSSRYKKPGVAYRQDDRTIIIKEAGPLGMDYVFKKSGRNLYTAYDDETGDFLELKITRQGEFEFYNYETGENWLIKAPAKRE
jgi:hypothetical protein